jgi:hypothetical protein
VTPSIQRSAAPGDRLADEDTHRLTPSFLPKEHPMTEKPELTALDLLKEARGQLFTDANRFEAHGLPHAETDRKLAKIDAFLAKTQDAGQ